MIFRWWLALRSRRNRIWLGAAGSALLAVNRLIFDDQDRPVQWLQGLYRPDRYQYEMQLSRVGNIDAKVWVSEALTAHFH